MGSLIKSGMAVSSLVALAGFLYPLHTNARIAELEARAPALKQIDSLEKQINAMTAKTENSSPNHAICAIREASTDEDYSREMSGMATEYSAAWRNPETRKAYEERQQLRSSAEIYSGLMKSLGLISLAYLAVNSIFNKAINHRGKLPERK